MKKFRLKVWGDFACFTRPEMKAERVSYDVMTPSAARAIFEAILWKPEIKWNVEQIEVLNPIKWINIRRNEVKSRASMRNTNIFIEDDRVQRAGLFLKDVAYVIHGRLEVTANAMSDNSSKKYEEMFERRASKGQCFYQPYLGCREFSAYFQLLDEEDTNYQTIHDTRELGWMLHDMDYNQEEIKPKFFRAIMEQGAIKVPANDSMEVKG